MNIIPAIIGGIASATEVFRKKPYRLWLWYNGKWNDHGKSSARRLKKYKKELIKTYDPKYILIVAPDVKPVPLKEGA